MGSYLSNEQRTPYYAMYPPCYPPVYPGQGMQQFPYPEYPSEFLAPGVHKDARGMQLVLVPMWVPSEACQPKRRRVSINGRITTGTPTAHPPATTGSETQPAHSLSEQPPTHPTNYSLENPVDYPAEHLNERRAQPFAQPTQPLAQTVVETVPNAIANATTNATTAPHHHQCSPAQRPFEQ